MQFTGRQLKDIGCPPDKIKFFVAKEFDSEATLIEAIKNFREKPSKSEDQRELDRQIRDDKDCAFQILLELNQFPWSVQSTDNGKPSKREIRQWLEQGAVRINGTFPKPETSVNFPIVDLVFFPGAKRQTTIQ